MLVAEGVAYGAFLTSGQTSVLTQSAEASRGAALGVYAAAGSVGDSVLPFALGYVADTAGLNAVFYIVGALGAAGAGATLAILGRWSTRAPRTA